MKKLYVTVSDNVYNGIERALHDYESLYDCKATKSLIVEKALSFYFSKTLCDFESSTVPCSTLSLSYRKVAK